MPDMHAEPSPLMDLCFDERAMQIDQQDALEARACVSIETYETETDILNFIQDNFSDFLRYLRYLSREDQELLMSYFLLGKAQHTLGALRQAQQSRVSVHVRTAIQTLGTYIIMGGKPTPDCMAEIFAAVG